jgi:polar amino acid transport system substrate-binding protein
MLRPGGVLVRTAFSLISAGTERAKVEVARKNLLGKALARPDQVRQVLAAARQSGLAATYQKVRSRLDALSPLGYSLAGIVTAVGANVDGLAVGDRVACMGAGYANHAEVVFVPQRLCARLPDGVSYQAGTFGTLGAIALQGLRQAAPTLGETAGVVGLGLLGLLTVQLLRASGCRVVGVDVNAGRCELARQLGAEAATAPDDPALDALARRFGPAGLDALILTAATASSAPIELAARLARDRARVVVVGAVGLHVPRGPFYDKELTLRLSRSYGPGRYDPRYEEQGVDYPIGYVRWTEGRNLSAFLDLLAAGRVDTAPLATHKFALVDAEQAYALVTGKTQEPFLGVLLDYGLPPEGAPAPLAEGPVQVRPQASADGRVGVALLGAGSFAQSMLLPHLARQPGVRLRVVATRSGLTARSVAERAGFETCTANMQAALADPAAGLVVIASRHDSHAALAAAALRAGKAVFVEKPLALSAAELAEVEAAHAAAIAPFLMVGFNRRFAPLLGELRQHLNAGGEPLALHYRVNAGYIPLEHWTQDPAIGGGRILGEVCHFVDLLAHVAGGPVVSVHAYTTPDGGRYRRDNLAAVLRFAGGSVGTLIYAANGDKDLGKERLEGFGGGRAAVLEDFHTLRLYGSGPARTRRAAPDKGHAAEMAALVRAVRAGEAAPVPLAEAAHATRVTFAIVESLETGAVVAL